MATCPRCAVAVPAYTRCDQCGLVLGFDGITVLMEFEDSPHFRRASRMARRQDSCSEWTEENGRRFLRVTYSLAELDSFRALAAAGAKLFRKQSFVNGLEIRWPAAENGNGFGPEFPLAVALSHHAKIGRAGDSAGSLLQNGRSSSPSH